MKNMFKRWSGKRFLAVALCVFLVAALLPVTAMAEEERTPCDQAECLAAECTLEGCLCSCHKAPVVDSEPVTVQTENTDESQTTEESQTAEDSQSTEESQTTEESQITEESQTAEVTAVTLTWLDQDGVEIAVVEKEAGYVLTQEDFPEIPQAGWYICGEDNLTASEEYVSVDSVVEQSLVLRAVPWGVYLEAYGDFIVGSDVTLMAVLSGFAGEEVTVQWQCCPIEADGTRIGDWADVEGAADLTYTYTITEEAQNLSWRVAVTVQ